MAGLFNLDVQSSLRHPRGANAATPGQRRVSEGTSPSTELIITLLRGNTRNFDFWLCPLNEEDLMSLRFNKLKVIFLEAWTLVGIF